LKVSVVVTAVVQVIGPEELKVGDLILWASCGAKVRQISPFNHIEFALIQLFPEDPYTLLWTKKYPHYYRISKCQLKKEG